MADSSFYRPTLETLINRIETDFNTRLPGGDSRLRRSVLNVLARTLAGAVHALYGYLDFIARQIFPDTAEVAFLEQWANVWGVTRKAATKATGNFTVTGNEGVAIPEDTLLQAGDGSQYTVTANGSIVSGTATVAIEAVTAGSAGNLAATTLLTFVSPLASISAQGTTDELSGGTDTELDEALRARLLARIQQPPHGGAYFDYTAWALEVPGVTRAWVYPEELGAGTVSVRFMMDDTYTNGIPHTGDVDTMQDYLDARRPVTADVTAVAPSAVTRNFSITLKKSDGTSETSSTIKAAIAAELADLIRREAEPGKKLYFSRINEAISVAPGEFDHILTSPAADVTYTTGQIPVMGTITWA